MTGTTSSWAAASHGCATTTRICTRTSGCSRPRDGRPRGVLRRTLRSSVAPPRGGRDRPRPGAAALAGGVRHAGRRRRQPGGSVPDPSRSCCWTSSACASEPRASSIAMTAWLSPPWAMSDMITTSGARVAGELRPRLLLQVERLADLRVHARARLDERRVQHPQGRVVVGVAVDPCPQRADVRGRREAVGQRARVGDRGVGGIELGDGALVLALRSQLRRCGRLLVVARQQRGHAGGVDRAPGEGRPVVADALRDTGGQGELLEALAASPPRRGAPSPRPCAGPRQATARARSSVAGPRPRAASPSRSSDAAPRRRRRPPGSGQPARWRPARRPRRQGPRGPPSPRRARTPSPHPRPR